jgi:hypothetical protein
MDLTPSRPDFAKFILVLWQNVKEHGGHAK